MTVDLYGPVSHRRHDLILYNRSDINDRMEAIQLNDEHQIVIFGDSAYGNDTHVKSYKDNTQEWIQSMKSVRISIEWNYATTANLFKYLLEVHKFKLLKSNFAPYVFIVATIFKNFHVALNGCQSSNYFNVRTGEEFFLSYITNS